jgi:lipopolysaccharide transport system permease protein
MGEAIRELVARRDLLLIMAWREVRIKYKQSIMGILWAVLMPIVIVCAGLIVRAALAAVAGKSVVMADLTSVAVKAAPWAFFVSALRFGTNSMISSAHLVTKIYLPRLIFPLSSVLAQLLDFVIAAAAVTIFLVFAGVGLSIHLLWLPVLVAGIIILTTGLAILFSAASLFLRDVKYLVDVFLSFAIFFTPVFYESALFGKYAPLLLLNPISPLLEGISSVVVYHTAPSLPWVAYSCAIALVVFALAVSMFKALEPRFAESI